MKTMAQYYKRVLPLLMAIVLSLGLTAVASAAPAEKFPVGIVDFLYLVNNHPNTSAANAALKTEQEQIRKEFDVKGELSQVLKYGILKERQAEIITDSLRALIMEAYGYKTKVFEFISSEHTPKNVMIVGQKITDVNPNKQQILNDIQAIKLTYGIKKHYLETLLEL